MIEGVDISHWNTVTDWAKVAQTKRFAIIASGDGTYLDPQFSWNLLGAYGAGMAVDIYHYLRFALSATDQARICRRRFDEASKLAPVRRLWLDLEDTSSQAEALTPADRRDWLQSVISLCIEPAQVGIYTGAWWWDRRIATPGAFENFPLWVASYGSQPILPVGWSDWKVWQYGDSGQIDGVTGSVDLNVAKAGVFQEGEMDEAQVEILVKRSLVPLYRTNELMLEAATIRVALERWLLVMGTGDEDEFFQEYCRACIFWRIKAHGWTGPESWADGEA